MIKLGHFNDELPFLDCDTITNNTIGDSNSIFNSAIPSDEWLLDWTLIR